MSAPRTATDATTVTEALARFEAEGFTGQLAAREGARVLCFSCREESAATDVRLEGLVRTEGASDPANMTAVVALACPRCDALGTLVLAFGPEAPREDDEVLAALDDHRGPTGVSTEETSR